MQPLLLREFLNAIFLLTTSFFTRKLIIHNWNFPCLFEGQEIMGIPKAGNSNQDFPYLLFVMFSKNAGAELTQISPCDP